MKDNWFSELVDETYLTKAFDDELGDTEELSEDNYYPDIKYENDICDITGIDTEEVDVEALLSNKATAAEYQGRKVTLNKPFRTPGGPKKFAVYTKNDKGKVVIVRFGDPKMSIKKDNPERRKSFRARHKCDTNPGPKWKARYWSCRNW
jgi:hypothetical protein